MPVLFVNSCCSECLPNATSHMPRRSGCADGFAFLNRTFPAVMDPKGHIFPVLGCYEVHPGRPVQSLFHVKDEKHGHYRGVFKAFLAGLVSHGHFQRGGTFFWRADDDGTMPTDVEHALYDRGQPLVTHAHFGCPNPARIVFAPDPHFIERRGFEAILKNLSQALPWQRRMAKVFWRGSTTGQFRTCAGENRYTCQDGCFNLTRVDMCNRSVGAAWIDAKIVNVINCCHGRERELQRLGLLGKEAQSAEWMEHRGILDVDGSVNAWGMYWRMASGSVLFRVESAYCNSYIAAMRPWRHYIPISSDLSDLVDKTRLITAVDLPTIKLLLRVKHNLQRLAAGYTYDKQVGRFVKALNHIWQSTLRFNVSSQNKAKCRVPVSRQCRACGMSIVRNKQGLLPCCSGVYQRFRQEACPTPLFSALAREPVPVE
eukprot:360166-Chlamydomonas_euryale.AAC.2